MLRAKYVAVALLAAGLTGVSSQAPKATAAEIAAKFPAQVAAKESAPAPVSVTVVAGAESKAPVQAKRPAPTIVKVSKEGISGSARVTVWANKIVSRYNIPSEMAVRIAAKVEEVSKAKGIDPAMMLGLIATESSFRTNLTSSAGAQGLTQVIPKWHRAKIAKVTSGGGGKSIWHPESNIEIGAMVFQEYRAKSSSDTQALQRYNGALKDKSAKYANKVFRHAQYFRD